VAQGLPMSGETPQGGASAEAGRAMYEVLAELYPICRSITGEGLRETLRRIGRHIPLTMTEVPSGTRVFDWTVPREWNIRDAWIQNADGERIVDFRTSNLHVVGYSIPVRARMSLGALRDHLHTLPDRPEWIPYRTSYYREDWGFCLPHRRLLAMEEGEYEVVVDSTLTDGALTYGECLIPGARSDEVLISAHVCHPSMCNDNLSGVVLAAFLAKRLSGRPLRYTYRFLFIPGTIGSITWLSRNEERVGRIRHGLVVASVGDAGRFTYKRSRRGNAEIDRTVSHVLKHRGVPHEVVDFSPYGYDERQYCSPGFDLPVGCLSRSPYGSYPEYHTSADDLQFVGPAHLAESLSVYEAVIRVLEGNRTYVNTNPKCEPQLGRRGLYGSIGGAGANRQRELAMLWVLNFSDGRHSLLDIADRSGLAFEVIAGAAEALHEGGLLSEREDDGGATQGRTARPAPKPLAG
jgi:aminopeptidase-like protein